MSYQPTVDFDRIVISIDRHFLLGLPSLSTQQYLQHVRLGACNDCLQIEHPGAVLEYAHR